MEGFIEYEELKRIDREFKDGYIDPDPVVFNLPEGQKSLSNVLEFAKDKNCIHPTQKPVELIRCLVRTYTNEGDTVLDNCMGSGTTAIACIKEKRHYIGFELNKEYFDKAQERIKAEQTQLKIF
jgi:DNA modification methylase